MNSYERIYDILIEDCLEEGKVKDFLKNAALVGVAAAAGRMGAMTAPDATTTAPAKKPGPVLNIKKTPRRSQVDTFAHLDTKPDKPKSKSDKSLLTRIKSISPKRSAPFSSGYRTTGAPAGKVAADIADKVEQHKKLNPSRSEVRRRKHILTTWQKPTKKYPS